MPGSVPLGAVRFAHYEDVEARLEPGASLVLYTDGVVERPGELARRGARAAEAGGLPHGLRARGDVRRDHPGDAPRRRHARRRGAARGARAAALRSARAAPPCRRGDHPVAAARARALAARGRRLVERDRGDHARLLRGLRQRDRACLRAGAGRARGDRLGVGGAGGRHLRARLRKLAPGARLSSGSRDGPDERSDGLRRRGLRRRRHHGPARPAARGPGVERPPGAPARQSRLGARGPPRRRARPVLHRAR